MTRPTILERATAWIIGKPSASLGAPNIAIDLRAIDLVEGVRAALSVAVLVALNEWLHWPLIREAALAAWLCCLCDQGGPIARRVAPVLTCAFVGAGLTALYGLARGHGWPLAVPLGGLGLFCLAFVRVYGQSALTVGNLLGIAVILSLDHALTVPEAIGAGAAYLVGGLWAAFLTVVLWPVRFFLPARRTLAGVYEALGLQAGDVRALIVRSDLTETEWEEHARAHRRAVREQIELARAALLDTVQVRGATGTRATQNLLRLEIAEQLFAALIAISEGLEHGGGTVDRGAVLRVLRRLRPVLIVLGRSIVTDDLSANPAVERAIAGIAAEVAQMAPDDRLRALCDVVVQRLRMAVTVATPDTLLLQAGADRPGLRERLLGPLRANLRWQSAALRHAVRIALVSMPALAFTVIHYAPYDHWLTITLVLVLQPYFASTWTRALERTAGTLLGGLVAAVIGIFCTTPLAIAGALFPVAVAALAIRRVSYGLFMIAVTPLVVLLTELGTSGLNQLQIVGYRAGATLAGGLLAVAGYFVLWPSWEPGRLRDEVRKAIRAHADYARAELGFMLNELSEAAADQARRAAGAATVNLEASLSRAMQEPGSRRRTESAMVIDAALRRMAGRLLVMQLDPAQRTMLDPPGWRAWRAWIGGALDRLAEGDAALPPHPAVGPDAETGPLGRLARQVYLLAGAIRRLPD